MVANSIRFNGQAYGFKGISLLQPPIVILSGEKDLLFAHNLSASSILFLDEPFAPLHKPGQTAPPSQSKST